MLRSVSFRSGLVSAVIVGAITVLGLLIATNVVLGVFFGSATGYQVAQMDVGRQQLLDGTPPSALAIPGTGPDGSFWIVADHGEPVASGGTVAAAALETPFDERTVSVEFSGFDGREAGFKTLDDREWYVIVDDVITEEASYRLLVAGPTDSSVDVSASDLLIFFTPVVLIVMLVTGVSAGLLTKLALKSVDDIGREVEQITRESLDRRVPNTGARDTIDKLADTMNGMLERLEVSSMQQSQFLADASHELRSPVAGVLAQLEIAVRYPDRVDATVLLPKLEAEAQRLQLLVDDLLFLSRSEALLTRRPAPMVGRVAIDDLFAAEVEIQRLLHPEVQISVVGTKGVVVSGVERDLGRVVRNLTDNAIRHAVEAVELGVTVVGHMASVTVRDDGSGIAPDDASRIFERFVRLDEGRARDGGGSGLGLAIVREVVRQHGGGVSIIDQERQGATFQVLLPLAEVPSSTERSM